jgi:cytochrome P450
VALLRFLSLLVLLSPLWVPVALLRLRGVPSGARVAFLAAIVAWSAAAIGLALAWPAALAPLAALVLVGWGWGIWRARPAAGRRRGWPPGSLGLRASLRALADYDFYHDQAARWGPVFKTSQYHRPVLCVLGLERCRRFLEEHHERLTSAPLPIDAFVAGGVLRYMEPEAHAKYRHVLQSSLRPQVLRACEPQLEAIATGILAELAEGSWGKGTRGKQPRAALDRLVFASLARLFLGIPEEDPALGELRRLYRDVDHRIFWWRGHRARAAMEGIGARVRDQAERLRTSQSGSATSFLEMSVRQDPDRAHDRVFLQNLAYLLHIARRDLTGLSEWLVRLLADHPEQATQIAAERASGRPSEAAERFLEETLRLRQSEFIYRTVADPIRFEGYSIPAGWIVRLCIRESHTSPEAFFRPREFDPDRFLGTGPGADCYQPFGIHDHTCLGIAVTRTIGRIFVERLATGYEFEVVRDGPMELGLHHHGHWRPSARFHIRLLPRRARSRPVVDALNDVGA